MTEEPRPISREGIRGEAYDRRFAELAASGQYLHGEADFVEAYGPRRVLDAGCGTGRVAIELARRGLEVAGVDADGPMVAAARGKAPELSWQLADLSDAEAVGTAVPAGSFDLAVMAGNVMIFVVPGTEGAVVANVARTVRPGGLVVAGFSVIAGRLDLATYDAHAAAAGLTLAERYATWERGRWTEGGDYAVSVHRVDGPR